MNNFRSFFSRKLWFKHTSNRIKIEMQRGTFRFEHHSSLSPTHFTLYKLNQLSASAFLAIEIMSLFSF